MTAPFKRIVLFGRRPGDAVPETLAQLYDFLKPQVDRLAIDAETAEKFSPPNADIIEAHALRSEIDLAIVVGGDGSLLRVAQELADQAIPVIGINRGRLGFLTDVNPDDFSHLTPMLQGDYQAEKRFLLYAEVFHNQQRIAEANALNDVVLLPGDVAQMIEFEVRINGDFLCTQRSDGMIVATPTGSTAYALSAGGPILHPTLDAMILVPLYPHTLTSRPIVLDANNTVTLVVAQDNITSPGISCDGRDRIPLSAGDTINVRKNREYLTLIHPNNYNYYEALRSKLYWSAKRC